MDCRGEQGSFLFTLFLLVVFKKSHVFGILLSYLFLGLFFLKAVLLRWHEQDLGGNEEDNCLASTIWNLFRFQINFEVEMMHFSYFQYMFSSLLKIIVTFVLGEWTLSIMCD